jgi:hypothetical protein
LRLCCSNAEPIMNMVWYLEGHGLEACMIVSHFSRADLKHTDEKRLVVDSRQRVRSEPALCTQLRAKIGHYSGDGGPKCVINGIAHSSFWLFLH